MEFYLQEQSSCAVTLKWSFFMMCYLQVFLLVKNYYNLPQSVEKLDDSPYNSTRVLLI